MREQVILTDRFGGRVTTADPKSLENCLDSLMRACFSYVAGRVDVGSSELFTDGVARAYLSQNVVEY